jgi:hypothetical protein
MAEIEGFFLGAGNGLAASIDGAIPFFNPMEHLGAYDPSAPGIGFSKVVGGTSIGVLSGCGASKVLGPTGRIFGTRYAGNRPLLNSNDSLRIGWSYIRQTREFTFRIGGKWVKRFKSNPHINLWPPSWWGK